jgi:hypothetical protein
LAISLAGSEVQFASAICTPNRPIGVALYLSHLEVDVLGITGTAGRHAKDFLGTSQLVKDGLGVIAVHLNRQPAISTLVGNLHQIISLGNSLGVMIGVPPFQPMVGPS